MEDNLIESLPTNGELKEVPTISEAAPTIEPTVDAVPLGEATPELIAEASKSDSEEQVKTIGDEGTEETKIEDKKENTTEETKTIGDKKETDIKDTTEDIPTDEFKVPEDNKQDNTDNKVEPEKESNWIDAGRELGLDIKTDDFEEVKKAVQHKETTAYEKGKAEAAKIELEKYTPEAQKLIEFLNSDPNVSIEDFVNPLRELDTVLALDDEGIIRKDLELKGWDADKIDDRIELLDKNGALDNTAYELRKIVEGNKEVVKSRLVENKKFEAEQRQNDFVALAKKENEQIKSTIEKTELFMGKKLNKEVKDFLTNKWESGEYRKMMQTNPEVAVKSMLHHYLGEQAAKEIAKDSFQKGRDNIQEKLHNIEQIGNGGETSGRKQTKVTHDNHFGAWDEAMKSGEGLTAMPY